MTRLVVRSIYKDDGLLDCSCIIETDYRNVNRIGRTCKLFGAEHLDQTLREHVFCETMLVFLQLFG